MFGSKVNVTLRGFEGLESRELFAGDLLAATSAPAPVDELCAIDAVPAVHDTRIDMVAIPDGGSTSAPAATLLLPYFEVDFTTGSVDTAASRERLAELIIWDGDFDRGDG